MFPNSNLPRMRLSSARNVLTAEAEICSPDWLLPASAFRMLGIRMRLRATKTKWIAAALLLAPIAASAQPPKPAPGNTNPLGHSKQAIEQGHEIFNHNCTVCHGLNGG